MLSSLNVSYPIGITYLRYRPQFSSYSWNYYLQNLQYQNQYKRKRSRVYSFALVPIQAMLAIDMTWIERNLEPSTRIIKTGKYSWAGVVRTDNTSQSRPAVCWFSQWSWRAISEPINRLLPDAVLDVTRADFDENESLVCRGSGINYIFCGSYSSQQRPRRLQSQLTFQLLDSEITLERKINRNCNRAHIDVSQMKPPGPPGHGKSPYSA